MPNLEVKFPPKKPTQYPVPQIPPVKTQAITEHQVLSAGISNPYEPTSIVFVLAFIVLSGIGIVKEIKHTSEVNDEKDTR